MQLSDLRNCLDRRFQLDGDRYTWRSTVGKFIVDVVLWRTNAETDCVRVVVSDCLTDLEVDEWSHSVRCTDNWRERLQELVGKAMIRAQHRPSCAACSSQGPECVPMLVRTSARLKSQFFGCANYRKTKCRRTVSVNRAFEDWTRSQIKSAGARPASASTEDRAFLSSGTTVAKDCTVPVAPRPPTS